MQSLELIFSLGCIISFYIYYKIRTWRSISLMPINWPVFGMTPSLLWNFHRFNDYITDILKENEGTFLFKGPSFANLDVLFTSDPANFQYVSTTNFHNYPKGQRFREIFDILGDGIFGCDSKLWELHRKTTMSLFRHPKFLNLVEKTIWKNLEKKLMPVLEFMSVQGSKMDLQEIFQSLTFESILNLIIYYDPKTSSIDLPYNKFKVAFTKSEETLFSRHFLPKWYFKFLNRFHVGNEKHLADAWKLSDELFYKFINETREKQMKVGDVEKEQIEDFTLLTGFMREYKNQSGSSGNPDKFLKDTLLNLLVAGRDTTSSALTWFFYLLAKNPIAKGNIRQEIHANLGIKEGEKWKYFGVKELETLTYLEGALCEALRLFPPVPVNLKFPRERDTMPSGHEVDNNTKIILHLYAMGRMETIWGHDCLEFKPERWLSEQGGIKHVPSNKFTTFHAGPRSCLGKNISMIQMKIVAAAIINYYDIEVMDDHPDTQNPSVLLQLKHGLMVKVTKKK